MNPGKVTPHTVDICSIRDNGGGIVTDRLRRISVGSWSFRVQDVTYATIRRARYNFNVGPIVVVVFVDFACIKNLHQGTCVVVMLPQANLAIQIWSC
jgi:hypothetical protein